MKPEEDPRMKLMERIIEQNRVANEIYAREMAENNEAAEMEGYDREVEKENAQFEKEQEDKENRVTPEEAIEMFTAPADEGCFGDLWENEDTRQKIIDAVDLEIAAGGNNKDWRTYERVGNRFRKRQEKLKPRLSESRGCHRFKASTGEAVVNYCEPLATLKMGYHRLSRRVNKMEWFFGNLHFTGASVVKNLHIV